MDIQNIITSMEWKDCQFDNIQKAKFIELAIEYEAIFLPLTGTIEFTPGIQHKIHLTDDTPIKTNGIRIPYALREKVNDHIQHL
jgi:hypothetical protein